MELLALQVVPQDIGAVLLIRRAALVQRLALLALVALQHVFLVMVAHF